MPHKHHHHKHFSSGWKDLLFAIIYILIAQFIQWIQCSSGFIIGTNQPDNLVTIVTGNSNINHILGLGVQCWNLPFSSMPAAQGILGILMYICMFIFLFLLIRAIWKLIFRRIMHITFR